MNGFIIIGAGEAGIRAALTLRAENPHAHIAILESESGEPYERPPLSKTAITEPECIRKTITTNALLKEKHIDLKAQSPVLSISPKEQTVHLSDGTKLIYHKLLIATGAHARQLAFSDATEADLARYIFTLRTIADCQRIRNKAKAGQKVILVGAGFIGLELAASLRTLDLEVTVLETQPRILQRAVPEPIANILHQAHTQQGVDICLNAAIKTVTFHNQHIQIILTSGEQLDADWMIVGIGSIPNTQIAEQAGLIIDNGIKVDAHMRTSDPYIYAAGDVCSFPYPFYPQQVRLESWRCAQEQAEVAAHNMLGKQTKYELAPWFWSDQYDLGLQMVGLPIGATQSTTRQLSEQHCLHFEINQQGQLLVACAIGKNNAIAKDIKLAERLINQRKAVSLAELADPSIKLKDLLKRQ